MDRKLDFVDYLVAQLEELANKDASKTMDEWIQLTDAMWSWIEAMNNPL